MSEFQRHPKLYFNDGNICLSAVSHASAASQSDSSAEILAAPDHSLAAGVFFRVHQSVLSIHSPIFCDMLGLPSTDDTNEKYDGVPLVHMPDSAEDLGSLLTALYYG